MSIVSETNQQQLLNQSTYDGSGLCATSRDHNINNLYTIFTIIIQCQQYQLLILLTLKLKN